MPTPANKEMVCVAAPPGKSDIGVMLSVGIGRSGAGWMRADLMATTNSAAEPDSQPKGPE